MSERGQIENRDRARQINDFSGLKYGKITPTDIDGFIDFGDFVFIWFELKHGDTEMRYGQQLALERQCNAAKVAGKHAFVLVASHDVVDPAEDVNAAVCNVSKYFTDGVWREPKKKYTLKQFVDAVLKKTGHESYIDSMCSVCELRPSYRDGMCEDCFIADKGWNSYVSPGVYKKRGE